MLAPVLDILTIEIPDTYTEPDVWSLPSNWRKHPAPTVFSEIQAMLKTGGGAIVNTDSVAGVVADT